MPRRGDRLAPARRGPGGSSGGPGRVAQLFEPSYVLHAHIARITGTSVYSAYRRPDFARLKELLKEPVVFDGRNLWEPERMREYGFDYVSIGRRPASTPQAVRNAASA